MAKNIENKVGDNKIYSFDEAVEDSKKYFKGDDMAAKNFLRKYALKDSEENLYESNPDQMHHRLAGEIARIEQKYENPMTKDEIYGLLKDFKYIVPQGGPMAGIGNDYQIASLSNCFVIGKKEDSYGNIMKTDEEQVQLMKRRGGVGHDLSHIRPDRTPVQNSALSSTGVVPFMERYSNSTREVAQDGRRGALMLTLSSKHPDVEGFIDAKMDTGKVTGANVSVKIDDGFMEAVKHNRENPSKEKKLYTQQFPVDSDNPKIKKEVNPNGLWDKIVHNAWKSAEPGILFWDKVKKESVADSYADQGYETVSTNPCGEIPLCPYDSCRLLAINLHSYVDNPFTENAQFNESLFKEHAQYAQRIMDDIVDLEIEKVDGILKKIEDDPEEWDTKQREYNAWKKIRHKAEEGRRTGVGITGEGDMLAALGLTYGTDKGNDFSEEVHKNLAIEAYRSSVKMARERGAFEIYDSEKEKDNPFINRIKNEDPELYKEMTENGRRNISLLTIAPTGTTSQMTQTTSGLEPVFSPAYKRRRKVNPNDKNVNVTYEDENGDAWEEYNVFHHKFEDWLKTQGYDVDDVKKKDKEELDEIVKKSPYHKATANDVDWRKKVELQGRVQKWVDHSISVTINLPEHVDEKLVGDLYQKAWEEGCKGVTVYRDGSRSGVLLNNKKNKNLEDKVELVQNNVKPHPTLEKKANTEKYKIKRQENGDSLHLIFTSDLYMDEKNKKAYFIPDEDFQIRAPLGDAMTVSFAQSGMDRTEILRSENPDYAEFVKRLQSATSNEEEGIGPRKIKSKEHAVGVAFEDYLLRNGIIKRDETTNSLVNNVQKSELKKIEYNSEEFKRIILQASINNKEKEIEVKGNNGKLGKKFVCGECGSERYTFKDGCNSPICADCGYDNGKGCG